MNTCPNCGKPRVAGAAYCDGCGTKLPAAPLESPQRRISLGGTTATSPRRRGLIVGAIVTAAILVVGFLALRPLLTDHEIIMTLAVPQSGGSCVDLDFAGEPPTARIAEPNHPDATNLVGGDPSRRPVAMTLAGEGYCVWEQTVQNVPDAASYVFHATTGLGAYEDSEEALGLDPESRKDFTVPKADLAAADWHVGFRYDPRDADPWSLLDPAGLDRATAAPPPRIPSPEAPVTAEEPAEPEERFCDEIIADAVRGYVTGILSREEAAAVVLPEYQDLLGGLLDYATEEIAAGRMRPEDAPQVLGNANYAGMCPTDAGPVELSVNAGGVLKFDAGETSVAVFVDTVHDPATVRALMAAGDADAMLGPGEEPIGVAVFAQNFGSAPYPLTGLHFRWTTDDGTTAYPLLVAEEQGQTELPPDGVASLVVIFGAPPTAADGDLFASIDGLTWANVSDPHSGEVRTD